MPAANASEMPTVAVSWGELIDKITILEIKARRLKSQQALDNVRKELAALTQVVDDSAARSLALDALKQKLAAVNEALWDIEDGVRAKEAAKTFDAQFVELARAVYHHNDERSALKREINALLKSGLVEEKLYTSYR